MPRRKQNCPKRLKSADEDPTMKSKSKDSIVGDDDKDLEDEPDSDSQSSFHDNESDMESQPEQQPQQQQTHSQKQQQQQISSPPPLPPPPLPSQEQQQRQSPEIDAQVKSKCKALPVRSPTPASPAKGSPSREMAPSPLRRSSVITEGSMAQTSIALPPTTTSTSSVSVITRTTSHSTHSVTPSRQSMRDRYKLINGSYRSFFTESNHCSSNSHSNSSSKNSNLHVNLHHHLIGSNATTTTTTATTTTTSTINNHKSHHNNTINNTNITTTANNNNNNSDQPLDLSKKSKPKSQTPPPRVANGTSSSSSGGLSSSLKSLQQRFGGDFHINGTNVRANKTIEDTVGIGQMPLANFGSNQLINRNISDYGNSVNVDLNAALKGSNNNSLINRVAKTPIDLCNEGMNNRYTTHRCSCQKVFSTLYDLSIHLQETHHIPAGSKDTNVMEYPKLVRGQDMWLNQESEQTRRILRCMQCGESFKTLPELTLHMMQTQHYTKIVSSDHGRRSHKCSSYCDRDLEKECIFKCKVCQETYIDMEGLANHMIMSGHHKKQILRSYNSPEILLRARRKRPFSTEEKPGLGANPTVATLLEFKRKCVSHDGLNSPTLKYTDAVTKEDDGYITCENCGKCIEMRMFVEHVRTCVRQRSGVIDALKMKLNVDEDQRRVKKSEDSSPGTNHVQASRQSPNSIEFDLSKVKKEPKEIDEKLEVSKEIPICSPSKVEPGLEEMDSSTPEMKVIPEKMQVCSPEDEDSASSNVRKDADRMPLDIIDPDNSSSVGGLSALRAMESFIQKSFKNKFDKNSPKESVSSGSATSVTQELKPVATPDSPTTKYLQVSNQPKVAPKTSSSLQNVPSSKPLLCKESNDECSDAEAEESFKSAGKELQSLSDMCEQITKQTTATTAVKIEEKSSSSSAENQEENPSSPMSVSDKKPAKEPLEEKYLQLPPTTEIDPSKSSALDSLSSFVYGQPMTCEHPLDSLQKLITNTDTVKMPSHGTQPPPKCQTITSSSSPDISIPLNLSTKCQKDDEPEKSGREDLSVSNNSTDAAHGEMTSPASDSDSGDYKCPACSRQCASKGSCRYHLSRCHLSSVKKFSIRDPFSMSPFVYLPLDHTAKFTKYYEMAHELANKSSVTHELTAKGK